MFCPKCGKEIDNSATFCPYCITPIEKAEEAHEEAFEKVETATESKNQTFANSPFVFNQGEAPHGDYNTSFDLGEKPKPNYPMKWYKFLTRFALVAIAIVMVISAIPYFTGSAFDITNIQTEGYTEDEIDFDNWFTVAISHEEIYAQHPLLQPMAIIIGVLDVLFAAYIIYTEVMLVKFKKKAPMCMYILIAIDYILPIVDWALLKVAGNATSLLSNIFSFAFDIAIGALIIYAHKKYFTTRAELFCND